MSDNRWNVAISVLANTSAWKRGMAEAQSGVRAFAANTKQSLQSLHGAFNSITSKLAAIGLGFGAWETLAGEAKLDGRMTRIALSVGHTADEAARMKEAIEGLAAGTGQSTESIAQGVDSLVRFTGSWDAAKASISAVNDAVTVTGVNAETISRALASAESEFGANLSASGAAASLIDKMASIGQNAGGLEHVAEMYGSIAMSAKAAGMGSDSALQLIGAIGTLTKNPEQMDAMAQATLRMFTNMKAMRQMHGVKLFEGGERRDPIAVLGDLQKKFASVATEQGRMQMLSSLMRGADARSMRSMYMLFSSDALASVGSVKAAIDSSAGNIQNKIQTSIDTTEGAAKRLKETLGKAADAFAKPINKAAAKLIGLAINKPGQGSMGLSGGELVGLAAGAGILGYAGSRYVGGRLGKWLGGGVGTAAGVAEGKALEATAGVTPVFVTNWPRVMQGGPGGAGSAAAAAGEQMAGGLLGKVIAGGGKGGAILKFLGGPGAIAAAATYVGEELINGIVAAGSKGRYSSWEEMIYDKIIGNRISKAWDATHQKPEINIHMHAPAGTKVTAETKGGANATIKRGSFDAQFDAFERH